MAVFQFEQLGLDEAQKVCTVTLKVGQPGYSWVHVCNFSIASNYSAWDVRRAQ